MDAEKRLLGTLGVPAEIKKIRIGEYDINYLEAGSGQPLLLIHGGNIGWGQWYLNIPAFTKHFKVYAIDLPGAGRSSRINYAQLDPARDFLDVTHQFIESHNLSNLCIVGSSIGGWVAVMAALKSKERVNKIVVSNGVGFTNYMRFPDKVISYRLIASLLSKTILKPTPRNKNIEKFIRDVFYDKDFPFSGEFIDYFYETMARSHNLLLISKMAELVRRNNYFDLSRYLPELTKKVLLIWGADDDLIPVGKCLKSIDKIHHHQLEVIEKAGHIPSIEKSVEFNEHLINYLLQNSESFYE